MLFKARAFEMKTLKQTYLTITIPTFIFGLLGNMAFLIALCFKGKKALSYMMIYIGNMTLADGIILFTLPFRMYFLRKTWAFDMESCLVVVSSSFVNMYVSIYTATAICVVRYIAIKYPFRAREIMSPRKAVVVCVLIWLIVCSLSALFHKVDALPANSTKFKCFQQLGNKPLPLSFILVLDILGFLLPLLCMTFCSIKVVRCLSKSVKGDSGNEKTQCIRIIITNLIVFIVSFAPFHFGFLLKYIVQTVSPQNCNLLESVHNFVHISFAISHTNCCLDIFTYYFFIKGFRKNASLSSLVRRLTCFKRNSVL
uniref:G protein-coupled receptor 35, tandem duplicate 1 n=1 Tax=Paramormyrops kingsleyae TaxID=1676925 RepID=A0A3B3RHR8_9TELE